MCKHWNHCDRNRSCAGAVVRVVAFHSHQCCGCNIVARNCHRFAAERLCTSVEHMKHRGRRITRCLLLRPEFCRLVDNGRRWRCWFTVESACGGGDAFCTTLLLLICLICSEAIGCGGVCRCRCERQLSEMVDAENQLGRNCRRLQGVLHAQCVHQSKYKQHVFACLNKLIHQLNLFSSDWYFMFSTASVIGFFSSGVSALYRRRIPRRRLIWNNGK